MTSSGVFDGGAERTVAGVHFSGLGFFGGGNGDERHRRRVDLGAGEANQRAAGRSGNLAGICDDDFEQCSRDRESVAKRGVFNHGRDNQRSGHIRNNGSGAIGATGGASAATGAPTASLVTTRNNSWVFGVGTDWDAAVARTVGANQSLVHQFLTNVGSTYWVQRQNSVTPLSGTTVTINDTAPTGDKYNLSMVEILQAP